MAPAHAAPVPKYILTAVNITAAVPTCGVGCDVDRYTEFWNVVFTQFISDGKGNYSPMEHPNIDTGWA